MRRSAPGLSVLAGLALALLWAGAAPARDVLSPTGGPRETPDAGGPEYETARWTMAVTVGLGTTERGQPNYRGGYVPVTVTLSDPLGFEGALSVELDMEKRPGLPKRVIERRVVVGKTPRRYTVYLYIPGSSSPPPIRISLRDDNNWVKAPTSGRTDLYWVDRSQVFIGVLGPKGKSILLRRRLDDGAAATGRGSRRYQIYVANLKPDELPDRAIGFEALNILVLAATPQDEIPPECREAIRQWVARGGTIVLSSPNRDWFLTPFIRSLAPGITASVIDPNTRVGARWSRMLITALINTGKPPQKPGVFPTIPRAAMTELKALPKMRLVSVDMAESRALFENPALARVGRFGLGRVVLTSFDLSSRELNTWGTTNRSGPGGSLRNLWGKMLTGLTATGEVSLPTKGSGRSSGKDVRILGRPDPLRLLLDISSERAPSILLIVVMVVAFLSLTGPGNHFLLRRYHAEILMVITIPVLAVLFAVVIVISGYIARGGTVGMRGLTLIELAPGTDVGDVRTHFSIYSTSNTEAEISTDSLGLLEHLAENSSLLAKTDIHMALGEAGEGGIRGLSMLQWDMHFFRISSTRSVGGPVRFHALKDSGGSAGRVSRFRVENASKYELRNVMIVLRERSQPFEIGTLAPETIREVSLPDGEGAAEQSRDLRANLSLWLEKTAATGFREKGLDNYLLQCITKSVDRPAMELEVRRDWKPGGGSLTRRGRRRRAILLANVEGGEQINPTLIGGRVPAGEKFTMLVAYETLPPEGKVEPPPPGKIEALSPEKYPGLFEPEEPEATGEPKDKKKGGKKGGRKPTGAGSRKKKAD